MRLVGYNETYSVTDESVIEKPTYEYSYKENDYFLKHHTAWDCAVVEYLISINGYQYMLPSGMYLLVGEIYGDQDWVYIDELIGREIEVFQTDTEFSELSFGKVELLDSVDVEVFYPQCKQIIPIADMTGEKVIMVSKSDHYHNLKNGSIYDMLVGG